MKLFPLSAESGFIQTDGDVYISGLPSGVNNDFGMTFACDDRLYLTSVYNRSLYQMSLDGTATLVGSEGSLGVSISAIAAYGNPVKLYGLGNGMDQAGRSDARPICMRSTRKQARLLRLGHWARPQAIIRKAAWPSMMRASSGPITDRRLLDLPSQVMRINTSTGRASDVRTTTEQGFEEPGDLHAAGLRAYGKR